MNILIIAATQFELQPLKEWYYALKEKSINESDDNLSFFITGIGLLETAINLSKKIQNEQYDCVIQIGIAGAFRKQLQIGQIVQVASETYGDLGAENNLEFLSATDLNWNNFQRLIYSNESNIENIESVNSISVNACSGNMDTINYRANTFKPDIENMEGLAFFKILHDLNIPYYQIRSISNYVTIRDTTQWNIPLAIENLTNFMSTWLIDHYHLKS